MKAIDVFGAVINYLKEHLLNLLKTRVTGIENQDIHWILTVPAIWSDSAKQIMREAAYRADIDHAQLTLVTEPEAESLLCQLFYKDHFLGSDGAKSDLTRPGTKNMIIDIGGETVDISVHERQADGGLCELYIASVDDLGGQKVDEEFCALLIRLLGHSVYQKFIDENWDDNLDLQREWEITKHFIRPRSNEKIIIKVPVAVAETYKEETNEFKEAIEWSLYSGKITLRDGIMKIDVQVINDLFKRCTDKIVSHIKDLLKQPDVQGTNIFFMVGGFSESPMLTDAIMKAFPHGEVIIPFNAGLTILRGALIFGHRPVNINITSSVSKYTYGINISPSFDPAKHPEDHRVFVGGINRCRDVFKKYIHKGETVGVEEARSGKHVQLKSHEKEMLLKVYASTKKDPKFVDEDNTKYLGNVLVNLPDRNDKIMVEVNMMLGEKGLTVEAVVLSQHTKYRKHFEYI